MLYMNFSLILKLIFISIFFNCIFFEKNKPIQSPGLGIKIKNNEYHLFFDIGLFTFQNDEVQRTEIENLINIVKQDIENQWNFLKIHPIIDQPLDAPFVMEKVVSKKLNPFIQTFRLKKKFIYHNNFIIEDNTENSPTKGKYFFLSSQLHHYLYSQVRYDLIIIPYEIISDFDYNNSRREIETHNLELGLAKGRTALDKLAAIITLDYKNPLSEKNLDNVKKGLISTIWNVPEEVSFQFDNKCKECNQYILMRKRIFDLYFQFNSGNVKEGCSNLAKYWIDWENHSIIEKHNEIIKKQIQENFETLKKRCNI